jgi:hypothetical protein
VVGENRNPHIYLDNLNLTTIYYRITIVIPSATAAAKPPIMTPHPSIADALLPSRYATFDVEAAVPVASELAVPVPLLSPVDLALIDPPVTPAASRSD